MRILTQVVGLAMVAGCATPLTSSYQAAVAMQTPETLYPNAKWALVLLDTDGHVVKTLIVRLTDRSAESCTSGDYKQLDVIAEYGDSGIPGPIDPAYEVKGAALSIELLPTLCDNYYSVIGGVTNGAFEGVHMEQVMIAPRNHRPGIRRAYGVALPN